MRIYIEVRRKAWCHDANKVVCSGEVDLAEVGPAALHAAAERLVNAFLGPVGMEIDALFWSEYYYDWLPVDGLE
jgi:hypothetical protein